MKKSPRRVIIKIGGSVLVSEGSFAPLASRIAAYLNNNPGVERAYIVVSAMKGITDRAIDSIAPDPAAQHLLRSALTGEADDPGQTESWDRPCRSLALLWGEIESAYLLKEALSSIEMPAAVVTQLGLYPIAASGTYLRACVDLRDSRRRFTSFDRMYRDQRIIILSGFGAVNGDGDPTLLGRNASDYVAAILSRLDARVDLVIFLKDVGGIYECYRTERQTLITATSTEQLRAAPPGKVLDHRVLDMINCDFHVTGAEMGVGGTIVRRGRPE